MPVYDYKCELCGRTEEALVLMRTASPICCGAVMRRIYGTVAIRDSRSLTGKRNELFIDRIDEIHKRQADKGERFRFVHPEEVMT